MGPDGAEAPSVDLTRLLDSTLALVSELHPREVLRRVTETACMLVEARSGALAITTLRGQKELVEVERPAQTGAPGPGPAAAEARAPAAFLRVPIASRRGFSGTIFITERFDGGPFTAAHEELLTAFANLAAAVIDNAELSKEARQQELWVALHGEIATALLAGVSFDKVLDRVTRGCRELIDADIATLCLSEGGSDLVVSAADGVSAERLLGQNVPHDNSLSGQVIVTGEPVILTDAAADTRTGEPILGLGCVDTAMVVPLALKRHTTGALAVGRSGAGGPLTQTDFWLLESFAGQISVALEYGQARTELERLALLDDQERIARDLHDTVIQQLFATGMSLQATARRISDPAVADRVHQAVEMLDSTIRDIRATVFALSSASRGTDGLRDTVIAVAEQVQEPYSFTTHVSFEGPVDTAIDVQDQVHLIATLREALSNVGRHARATRVEVGLCVGADIRMTVCDDGVGIKTAPPRMSGLKNLASRARELGGDMDVTSLDGGGTRLEWAIPLDRPPPPRR